MASDLRDPADRKKAADTIAGLKAERLSIIPTEQSISLPLDLADDVAIINTGAIVFTGSAEQSRRETPRLPVTGRILKLETVR